MTSFAANPAMVIGGTFRVFCLLSGGERTAKGSGPCAVYTARSVLPCLANIKMMIWTKEAISHVLCSNERGICVALLKRYMPPHHELAS
jgi:hypothetical protein